MIVQQKELEGVLLVDKPTDHTSHDVVARLRGILKMKRVGHAGTLDPMATGLLVMLLGKATSSSQYLLNLDKEYVGTIKLGVTTNTQDAEGEIVSTQPVPALTADTVQAAIRGFLGDQYQKPPMFSAVKINGVPLYKSARRGEEVEREARFIRVISWELTRCAPPELDFKMRVTKGTYVRTLANDLGDKLGCGGHLSALRRTGVGKLDVSQALTLEEIEKLGVLEIGKRLLHVRDVIPAPVAPVSNA